MGAIQPQVERHHINNQHTVAYNNIKTPYRHCKSWVRFNLRLNYVSFTISVPSPVATSKHAARTINHGCNSTIG